MMELTDLMLLLYIPCFVFFKEYFIRGEKLLCFVQKCLAAYAVDLEQTDKLDYEMWHDRCAVLQTCGCLKFVWFI